MSDAFIVKWRLSGAVGLPAILKIDACIHDGFVGFRDLDKKLLPIFFASLLQTLREVSRSQATGAIWQNLTTDQVKEWKIICPPVPLQRKLASAAAGLERLRGQQREAARQAEHLFQTLLHKAFRGELSQAIYEYDTNKRMISTWATDM